MKRNPKYAKRDALKRRYQHSHPCWLCNYDKLAGLDTIKDRKANLSFRESLKDGERE